MATGVSSPILLGNSEHPFARFVRVSREQVEKTDVFDIPALQYVQQQLQAGILGSVKLYKDAVESGSSSPALVEIMGHVNKMIELSESLAQRVLHAQEAAKIVAEMKKAAKEPATFSMELFQERVEDLNGQNPDDRLTASLRAKMDAILKKMEQKHSIPGRVLNLGQRLIEAAKDPRSFSIAPFQDEVDQLAAEKVDQVAIQLLRNALAQAQKGVEASLEAAEEEKKTLPLPKEVGNPKVKSANDLLQNMKDSIQDQAVINQNLDLLEKLQMDAGDLPSGKKNLAHYLYERLYFIYKAEAEKPGSRLKHPHDPAYKNDFGRFAFRGDVDRSAQIDRRFLIQTLEQVHSELKEIWK